MLRLCATAFCLFAFLQTLCANEFRATWLARDSLTSKSVLAQAMNTIASNNFNTVFVNAWSRGYPLWKSQVFSNETGLNIDPGYVGRDILAEAVAEGHRNGLHVFAWFEYGFVGGYTGYFPGTSGKGKIFDVHPSWVAVKNDGTQMDSSSFYWMTQTRPEVQQFLINLASEVAANYDLDGIEFDRVRYSSLAYGYDDYTKALYQTENGGQLPPAQTNNTAWIRWRADKLNQFVANTYDAIKSVYPQILVSSAPSAYGSSSYTAYNSFCQDWVWWINSNKLDQVEVQSYQSTANSFSNILNFIGTQVADRQKVFPSFAINPNSVFIDSTEILKFPAVTRVKNFGGNAIWYYVPLNTSNYLTALRTNVYLTITNPPGRAVDWRNYQVVRLISDNTNAAKTGSWPASAFNGYSGSSCYAQAGALATVDYFFDVPVTGKYEIYVYTISSANRTSAAEHRVFDSAGNIFTNFVNQTDTNNAGWLKLGDYLLEAGRSPVVQISNRGLTGGQLVSADAAMIILNRRLSTPLKLVASAAYPNNGLFRFFLNGASGQRVDVESSSNFLEWVSRSNITFTNFVSEFTEPFSSGGVQVFRARLAP